jgi:hypothetical protein
LKIILTEQQLQILTEALGVPDEILDASEKLYQVILENLKTIQDKEDEYNFSGSLNVEIGKKKKIKIKHYNLTITVEEIDDYKEKPDISSMGVQSGFMFDRNVLLQRNQLKEDLDLFITFVVNPNWEPHELVEKMVEDQNYQTASLAHELKHQYDKQAKELSLIGKSADYQAIQQTSIFGIPAIDRKFFRYAYFISMSENLVRPVEVASQMRSANVSKSKFRDFIENERVYKELLEIKNYTFDKFIEELHEQMFRVDALLDHIGTDYSNMTDDEKIKEALELVYMDSVNKRMDIFVNMTSESFDSLIEMSKLFGNVPSILKSKVKGLEETNKVRQKFLNQAVKYQKNPIKFFEDEIENFNFVATKYLKKIGKLYSMAKDDENMNESIQNWDLHQRIMEKKYGKRKISTTYKYKNFK